MKHLLIQQISSEILTKTSTESSIKINQALENSNDKLLEIRNNRGILASYLLSPLSKITISENANQFSLKKDHNSNRVNDLSLCKTLPVTLRKSLLTFRDRGEEFEFKGDQLKVITDENYNVDLAKVSDKKIMFEFAKEMYFDVKAPSNKSTRVRSLIKLLKSQGRLVSVSSISSSQKETFLKCNLFTI